MLNWYEIPGALDGIEKHPAFIEKKVLDETSLQESSAALAFKRTPKENSWVKKRNFKKKMFRQFLSINPDLNFSLINGIRLSPSIFLCFSDFDADGRFKDYKMEYNFNPYTRVYLTPSGYLRKYHGTVEIGTGIYDLDNTNKFASKVTNRRLRQHATDEEYSCNYSYYKKVFGPKTILF